MNCKICSHSSDFVFAEKMLSKYDVAYYKCSNCGFIQTEEPHWLAEAYSSAITSLDIGLLYRNFRFLPITSALIELYFNRKERFIDYGGGYGTFTRLMRDKGYDYHRQDIYCENLFAKNFDFEDFKIPVRFELLTAFEVFEHLQHPTAEVAKMLTFSDNIFFSTELVPDGVYRKEDWWYFAPETGQHVSLYTKKSLQLLAQQHGLNFYTNNVNLHLFTRKKINASVFKLITRYKVAKLVTTMKSSKKSLLNSDFQMILEKLKRQ